MKTFELVCLSLPGLCDPAVPIAASRAGALGILDLSLTRDGERVAGALSQLDRYGRGARGVRLDGRGAGGSGAVERSLPPSVGTVLLSSHLPGSDADTVRALKERGLRVVLEVTSLPEARAATEAGADLLLARGHEGPGRVGEETSFVLLQRLLDEIDIPVWVQGGIGLHTAAACYVAGAAGVVLDSQLALARESRVGEQLRDAISRMDGSETACLEPAPGVRYRVYSKSGARAAGDPDGEDPLPLGQDAAFAAPLAQRFRTVGGIVGAIRRSIDDHLRAARSLRCLDRDGPLAQSHGTPYPLVQGPMTRVSDAAPFALDVSRGGGLPFLALALLRAPDVNRLLEETRTLLGERPWGVGILGFVPLELRQEQLEVIRKYRPSFALIAGGRPDQATALEKDGIPTYLHVPSPGLLKLFLDNGSRRFVFEGRECGGHVGPRSSFVLWNTMIDVLLESLTAEEISRCHLLFAGGIHGARSAAMVAAMTAPLAEKGAKIGVLMGTAYLFTREAVTSGAIVEGFQEEALECDGTVLLETGPGHATRCSNTAFAEIFREESRRLSEEGRSPEEIRAALEEMNLGRLRIASKGIRRHPQAGQSPESPRHQRVGRAEQREHGMYMIGQIAAARKTICTIQELHQDVSVAGCDLLDRVPDLSAGPERPAERPCDIAIIGMGCLLPKAPSVAAYWDNILNKVDAITEIPQDRWDWRLYFDPDPTVRDKIYSRWGGFLSDVPFDPMRYGMPPNTLSSIEPLQLLTLEVVRSALEDSGYLDQPHVRPRTSVVLGAGGGVGDLGNQYGLRAGLPLLVQEVPEQVLEELPEWTEDSFAGILLNVAAGRVANRFDFGGSNYTVDAACASSLAAVYLAVKELESGTSDMVVAGGADTVQNPFGYLCFSKTKALSPRGRCRTFDASTDGIVISEGLAALVLKRLADAERDGDRIYAVIKGIASSSDGRDKGLTAPRREGQILALQRAYDRAGLSPSTVGLIEAHGTGTVAGDRAEVDALKSVFGSASAGRQSCAIGSVKSMIGHTKCTAGVAGLIKVVLSLYHKVLPPTLHVEEPNPKAGFPESPFYVNTETRPWIRGSGDPPRRAGVSAFGFGGTNFHVVVEEDAGEAPLGDRPAVSKGGRPELLLWRGADRKDLDRELRLLEEALDGGARPELPDLAFSLWRRAERPEGSAVTLAVTVSPGEDLRKKVATARRHLSGDASTIEDPTGIWFRGEPLAAEGKIAFLFPGQGSQYPGMLGDLAVQFHEVRESFERTDDALAGRFSSPLSRYVFPPPPFTTEERAGRAAALTETNVAQPALGAADTAILELLAAFGVRPDMAAGHSYGEYVALRAAGVFDETTLAILSEARGRCIIEAARDDLGSMAAVPAGRERVEAILRGRDDVWIANLNAPEQTVISGTREGIKRTIAELAGGGIEARLLPVACAFHSPLVAPARDRLARVLDEQEFRSPAFDVFSNTTATPYPKDGRAAAALLAEHLVRPVRFADELEAMHAAGARIFVEAGPRGVLTGLARQTLGSRPHLAIATDAPGRPGLLQLLSALGQMAAGGVPVRLERLFQGRAVRLLKLESMVEETRERPLPPTTWMVNGGKARPLQDLADGKPAVERAGSTQRPAVTARGEGSRRDAAHPAAPQAPASLASADGVERILSRHHELMARFLETQRAVILSALQGSDPASPSPQPEWHERMPEPEDVGAADAGGPPVEAPPPAPEESVISSGRIPRGDGLKERLLQLVSDRTGYPPEMLGLEVDMEADLGIDSIKRVEILGVMQKTTFPGDQQVDPALVEELNACKTLGAVLEWFEKRLPDGAKAPDRGPEPEVEAPREADLPRFELVALESEAASGPSHPIATGGVHLIAGDWSDLAGALAKRIRERGGQVALLRPPGDGSGPGEEEFELDAAGPRGAAAAVEAVRRRMGSIVSLIHLPRPGGDPPEQMDLAAWRARLDREVKSFFHLARAAAADMTRAARSGEATLLAATSMGGRFGLDGPEDVFPGGGGLAGLTKSLLLEWEGVRSRTVDLDGTEPVAGLADHLLGEMTAGDAEPEVGYRNGKRYLLRARPAPAAEGAPPEIEIGSGDVILVTGGARGITAEVACEIAARYRPTLILAGRSPLPSEAENEATRHLETPREIKAALMERMRAEGEAISLPRVEAAHERLRKEREIRANLARLREAGATVEYVQVDVRNEAGFGSLVDDLYHRHGRIDGVIHGAGIIEDKLLVDKAPESFDRVFDTKADSAFILSRRLRPDSLKFLVFFASVSGPFGSRGQCDYAAANEVVNRLAARLGRRWPCRVVSINWGPWGTTGMAGEEVQKQFRERGVQIIPLEAGRRMLDREIRHGSRNQSAVVVGGGPWPEGGIEAGSNGQGRLPLLDGIEPLHGKGEGIELIRKFDPAIDLYLGDHRLDGNPVVPAAVAMELMAEVAQRGWPDLHVAGLRDLRVLKGLVIENGAKEVRLAARAAVEPPHDRLGVDVSVEITDPANPALRYYRATLELSDRIPEPPSYRLPFESDLKPFEMRLEEAYRRYLFHGPLFQGIESVRGMCPQGMVATLVPSSPSACLKGGPEGQWLIDPVVFDSGLQMVILWARSHLDVTPLPSRYKRYRRFGSLSEGRIRCDLHIKSQPQENLFYIDLLFLGPKSRLVGMLEGMECPSSKALNRLAGGGSPGA